MTSSYLFDFDDFLGQEKINCEYKEFTLPTNTLERELCERYCQTNEFNFNKLVIENLKKYFDNYLPKYISCFLNLSDYKSKLYIGVNDMGFVRGIPYKGCLPITKLTNYAYTLIYRYIKLKQSLDDSNFCFFKYIKINFNKINFNKKCDKNHPEFANYLEEKKKFKKLYSAFLQEHEIWKNKFDFINKKLTDLVNLPDSREMLINYIKSIEPTNPIIELLLTDYQLETKTHVDMVEYKKYNTNPYYWVSRWKDEFKDHLLTMKPQFNSDFPLKNVPYNLIQSIHKMIPYWMNYNDNMNLYLISFDIVVPIIKELPLLQFLYYDKKNKKWYFCRRQVLINEPMCIKLLI